MQQYNLIILRKCFSLHTHKPRKGIRICKCSFHHHSLQLDQSLLHLDQYSLQRQAPLLAVPLGLPSKPLGSRDLTIESSSINGILIGFTKRSLAQVLVSQLDSLHILLLLDKHVSILKELLDCHLRLLKSWGSFP